MFISWLLWIIIWWTWKCRYLYKVISFFLGVCPAEGLPGCMVVPILNFFWHLHTVFHNNCTNLHFYQQCTRVPFSPQGLHLSDPHKIALLHTEVTPELQIARAGREPGDNLIWNPHYIDEGKEAQRRAMTRPKPLGWARISQTQLMIMATNSSHLFIAYISADS